MFMKAIVFDKYGPPEVLELKDVAKPIPKDDEVLIKIHATTVTAACMMVRTGKPVVGRIVLGLFKPRKRFRTPGSEFAGEVEAIGKNVERFKLGDQVFGFAGFGMNTLAEYKCMLEHGSLEIKPANLDYEQAAAAVDGSTSALFFLRDKAKIKRGQKVLIIGASGSLGTYGVQLAKYFGAEVTGVCSGANFELVESLGADKLIDYTEEDFTTNGETYDIIFDTLGKSSFSQCKASLKETGCYVPTVNVINSVLMRWTRIVGGKKVIFGMSMHKNEGLKFVRELIEKEKLRVVIDRRYPLEQIAEAHRYVQKGHKKGNVIITVE